MEKLKVGDNVCLAVNYRYGNGCSYYFSKVIRITPTTAILENGKKLKINAEQYFGNIGYSEIGDKWTQWKITTPEILQAAKEQKYKNTVEKWFNEKKFTYHEKKMIYKLIEKGGDQ